MLSRAVEGGAALAPRALGSLYLAGALIGLVSLLLPHPARADTAGLYSNVGLALAGGIVMLTIGPRLPRWSLQPALAAGTILITRAVLLSADPVSFYSVWFIWVGLYAFYFLTRGQAAAHVAFAATAYAFTLVHMHTSSPVARWLTTVATLMVAGVFIDTLVRRARREASTAAASAARMTRLAELAHDLAGVADSGAARPRVCAAAARVMAATSVTLWEPTADGASLTLTATWGNSPERDAIPFAGPPAKATEAFTSNRAVWRRSDDMPTESSPASLEAEGRSLWQPVRRDQVPVAVLCVYWQVVRTFDGGGLGVLADLVAAEVAVTLERVELLNRLELVARTDELTGLPNRRAWQEALPRELSRSGRSGEPLCVAMLDLDHFKTYNDERGHQAADRLLKQVTGAWCAELRSTDILARYGGDEFALLLPMCDFEAAETIVERLRTVIPVDQTASAGLAWWDGSETPGELIERADQALYNAKRGGRDRLMRAPSLQPG